MVNNEVCIHGGSSPVSLLKDLHHSQAGSGRHKCPTCAYEQGFNLGSSKHWASYDNYCSSLETYDNCQIGSKTPSSILLNLGSNQGGNGRHKCTNCAFKLGFQAGLLEKSMSNLILHLVPAPNNFQENTETSNTAISIDFIEQEIKNKQLGYSGEEFILKYEKEFLINNNRKSLAKKVIHVSKEIGDGLGYDILSFDLDDNEKKIEVKTTRGDITRPFYLSRNELEYSAKESKNYHLYRVFDFNPNLNRGKYYVISGNLKNKLKLTAMNYKAFPLLKEK